MRPIAERILELAELHAQVFGSRSATVSPAVTTPPAKDGDDRDMLRTAGCTDDELIDIARRAANGDRFSRLYVGEWRSTYESQSQADLALCGMLSFWTQGDAHRIDGLFRRSGLMRPKWDRRDYRERTIERAILSTSPSYQLRVDLQCEAMVVRLESVM
jgi:putative DNA primase/helicase